MTRFCNTSTGLTKKQSITESIKNCKGGQSKAAARQIADRLNVIPHEVYVEPFLGVGNVWRATDESPKEVLNDKDCDRTKDNKLRTCDPKDKTKCERLAKAQVTCGRDYRPFLKTYDKKGVLIYLDPPYASRVKNQNYKETGIDFPKFVDAVKNIKNASVAISYNNDPEFKKVFSAKNGFKMHEIKKSIMRNFYIELLAVKKRA